VLSLTTPKLLLSFLFSFENLSSWDGREIVDGREVVDGREALDMLE
jgi:hypothetical protein